MSGAKVRDVAPILKGMRDFLLGRPHTLALRFEPFVADRTQPPPDVPGGPAHKLSANYYYARDPRDKVTQPIDLTEQKLVAAGAAGALEAGKGKSSKSLPTPGPVYSWD